MKEIHGSSKNCLVWSQRWKRLICHVLKFLIIFNNLS